VNIGRPDLMLEVEGGLTSCCVPCKLSSANRRESGRRNCHEQGSFDGIGRFGEGRPTIDNDVLAVRPSAKPCHVETFRVVPPCGGIGEEVFPHNWVVCGFLWHMSLLRIGT